MNSLLNIRLDVLSCKRASFLGKFHDSWRTNLLTLEENIQHKNACCVIASVIGH